MRVGSTRLTWAVTVAAAISAASVAPARAQDCNGNGARDADDIATGASADCNGNLVPDDCELPALVYAAAGEPLATGDEPRGAAVGDLDGDARLDLAVPNFGSDDLSVFLGSADGGFGSAARYPARKSPAALLLADADGDGDLDVCVANSGSHDISILANLGKGMFGAAQSHPCGSNPQTLVALDQENDGKLDLAVANRTTDTVTVLAGLGDGAFAPGVTHPVGDAPRSLVAVELDGDGLTDLAVANSSDSTVTILHNAGGGSFTHAGDLAVGRSPLSLAAGDLDGDLDSDLATADFATRSVTLLINRRQQGFSTESRLGLSGNARELALVDIDGDSDLDVVANHSATIQGSTAFFRNNGDATFHEAETRLILLDPSAVTGADLDQDGIPELLFSSQPEDLLFIAASADDERISLRQQTISADLPPHCMALGDFDGDAIPDIATGNGGTGKVVVFKNAGDASFPSHRLTDAKRYLVRMAAGDLDGDGDLDLVSGYVEMIVLLNAGDASFAVPQSKLSATATGGLVILDLDQNGALDIASGEQNIRSVAIYLNAGRAELGAVTRVALDRGVVSLTGADFTGDGQPELGVALDAGAVAIVSRDAGGNFSKSGTFSGAATAHAIAPADLDDDGRIDLVTTSALFRNEGDAVFRPAAAFPGNALSIFVTSADVNGDGRLDVIIAQETPGSISIVENSGNLRFGVPITFRIGLGMRAALAGDLDGDGDADIATADRGGNTVTVLVNDTLLEPAYLERICTAAEFHVVSVPTGAGDAGRAGKFLAPARSLPDLLPTVFQNVGRYPLHQEFLTGAFPERFPVLGAEEYFDLTARRATRQYYTGAITLIDTDDGPLHGFSVATDPSQKSELLTVSETRALFDSLRASFHLTPLGYYPDTRAAQDEARSWSAPGFPIYLDAAPTRSYQAYTQGVNYGRVRLLTPAAFAEANGSGRLGWQDLLVIGEAPADIEGVVAGILTSEPQGVLSHLAVRTARRGTPNAFLEEALALLAPLDGKLARLEVRESDYTIREATLVEAEAWWSSHRPRLTSEPLIDEEYSQLDSLLEMDLSAFARPESRFGGKATNFARLQSILTGDHAKYRAPGFAIPVKYYLEFLRSNRTVLPVVSPVVAPVDPGREVSYEEYLHELLSMPEFQGDSSFRFEALRRFREEVAANGVVDEDLVRSLALRITDVFGSARVMVRFRSSSNVEDALEFNGAGLYESDSACAADSLDQDEAGPSRCDSSKSRERTIAAALKRVWASLWTFRGHEERAFYQIPQARTAMAILVTQAFDTERANGVAFTGNPSNPADARYIINAQIGEKSVVSPQPGETPEVDALTLSSEGRVTKISRVRRSALVPDGFVLTDPQLEELGGLLWHIDQVLPIDTGAHARRDILLDVEFKIDEVGSLAIKQVRPFLTTAPEIPAPAFELVIPAGAMACGGFVVGRDLVQEYALKSRLVWKPGRIALPAPGDDLEVNLFEAITVGPLGARAAARSPGILRAERIPGRDGKATHRFDYEQEWALDSGERFQVKLLGLTFESQGGAAVELSRTVGESFWTDGLALEAGPVGDDGRFIVYGSCTNESLPLWKIEAELRDGVQVTLHERMRPSVTSTGPASLTRAVIRAAGREIAITEYEALVYSALRHNQAPRYRIVLPEPLELAEVPRPVWAIELQTAAPELGLQAAVRYLDAELKLIVQRTPLGLTRQPAPTPGPARFRRGDADASGDVDIADAATFLAYVFRRGPAPPCLAAADANDDGRLNVTDAIAILLHLFAGRGPLPAPFGACGEDPTSDDLGCEGAGECR